MKAVEEYQLETVLAGERIACERIEYARALRQAADKHSPYTHVVLYDQGYFVVGRFTGEGDGNAFGDAGRSGVDRRSGEDRRAPRNLYAEDQARSDRQPSGEPPVETPCADCTQECAVYRVIPVDEATLEFVFLKSRKFLGGPTEAEFSALTDEALTENPALDYAEVVTTRDRKAFEASAGTRLVIPNRRSRPSREELS